MSTESIYVKGAREHNLKNLELTIPKRQLVVFTGPSGSGKSSLAFDTLFAEGQRRYVESLSAYARQFLGQLEKPQYDEIRGLSPTISIEQKSTSNNPRSTVGTITEIYDYLRVLYARVGRQHCWKCGDPVGSASSQQIVDNLMELDEGTKFLVLAPLVRNRKGEFRELFDSLRKRGFTRAIVDGDVVEIADIEKLKKSFRHTIDAVVDRMIARPSRRARIADSVEIALELGDRNVAIRIESGDRDGERLYYSERAYCARCDIAYPPLTQQSFSFNSPLGACSSCNGLGTSMRMDPDKVVPDPSVSIAKDAIEPYRRRQSKAARWNWRVLNALCEHHGINTKAPWADLPDDAKALILEGSPVVETLKVKGRKRPTKVQWEGVLPQLARYFQTSESDTMREYYGTFLAAAPCESCGGARLRKESRAVLVAGRSLPDVCLLPIEESHAHFEEMTLEGADAVIGEELLKEIRNRLGFLLNVGLSYLSLMRQGPTLSGGEAQRIRLASQLGSQLSGVLYILDEPSIGLHQRDNLRLLQTLEQLRDGGNSVIVVEHDQETMEKADWIVDFGPGAGSEGGEILFSGRPSELLEAEGNITADYLAGRKEIEIPTERRSPNRGAIEVLGARENNLRDIDLRIPLGTFTCVTGVSGAGKSTFVGDILYPAAANVIYTQKERDVGAHREIKGLEGIDKVIQIDQKPIGRTPRSNPATYTKLFDHIRSLFAKLPDSQIYGFKPGRFSFNVKGGRCEACLGAGVRKIEMLFLADVYVTCDVCRGRRFNEATLRVKYRGHSIADVLALPVREALELFEPHPKIRRALQTLDDVGLGYLQLGQSSTTLSGGEAQRIKLSRELAKIATGDTLYILDEPSTGLHFDDIRKLLHVVQRLVDAGNTVVMIEHNLDIIKTADHIIDLGPEGGSGGGWIVAEGTPEEVAQVEESFTGGFLRKLLGS